MYNCILEAKNITKSYIKNKKILDNINLKLEKGKTLGIVGESGSGKSTLLRILCGLEKSDSGQILFKKQDITSLKGENLRIHRKNIQMIFQDSLSAFHPRIKAWQAVTEPIRNYNHFSKYELKSKAIELFNCVNLPLELLENYPNQMSGGQRQRLAIARALALEPQILLCDEATSALDVRIQAQIIKLLADIQRQRNLSIIFVCHDLALVKSISHNIIVMNSGHVVEYLSSDNLITQVNDEYTKSLLNASFFINY